ncbi:MAG TPA: DUF2796 domain-containing protein [Rhodocyclaceae bacterium]|nr:DUF2796 domain-containing protein [Rhodocyclaceae bacterium]
MQTKPLIAGLALILSSSLGAQQTPHEHGVGDLRIAVDANTVVIEFESPLDNLVGFEHAPRDAEQRRALADAQARLRQFDGLFAPSAAAACVLAEVQLESPYADGADAHGHDDHGHDDHGHDDHGHDDHGHDDHGHDDHGHDDHGHDDHGHDDHGHGGHEHDHAGDEDHDQARAHADLYVVYQLECAQPEALRELEVGLFDAFPRLHAIRAQTVTPRGQAAVRLDRASTGLPL